MSNRRDTLRHLFNATEYLERADRELCAALSDIYPRQCLVAGKIVRAELRTIYDDVKIIREEIKPLFCGGGVLGVLIDRAAERDAWGEKP